MMTSATDASLLTAFARHRDEKAFRTLAERHFGLIFHTALRRTGNRALAEDVSQEVLCILARKAASLAAHPDRLPSWLHRTSLFECTTAMRKEISQQRRLHRAHAEAEAASFNGPIGEQDSSLWQRALPHLDLALDKLPEADRRVLLLHFFERLPFPRIAALMGKSPAAVQKQSIRALDKLARLLRPKGVIVSAIVLAAGLATESAKAVPAALLPSLTATAISSTAGISGLSLITHRLSIMAATHSKILVPCTLLLMLLPLGMQQLTIAQAERDLARLTPSSVPTTLAVASRIRPALEEHSAPPDALKLAEEAWLVKNGNPFQNPVRKKLSAFSDDQLAKLLEDTTSISINEEKRDHFLMMLADTLGPKNPALVVRMLNANGQLSNSSANTYFEAWIKADPGAAKAWLLELQQKPEFSWESKANSRPYAVHFYNQLQTEIRANPLADLQTALLRNLISTSLPESQEYLAGFPPDTWQIGILLHTLQTLGSYGPSEPKGISQTQAANAVELIRTSIPPSASVPMLREFAYATVGMGGTTLAAIDPLIQTPGLSPEEKRVIAETAAMTTLGMKSSDSESGKLPAIREWLKRVIPEEADDILISAQATIREQNDHISKSEIESLQSTSELSDPELVSRLTALRFGTYLPQALQLAERIKDPAKRASTIQILQQSANP